jgi:hypothetical protein
LNASTLAESLQRATAWQIEPNDTLSFTDGGNRRLWTKTRQNLIDPKNRCQSDVNLSSSNIVQNVPDDIRQGWRDGALLVQSRAARRGRHVPIVQHRIDRISTSQSRANVSEFRCRNRKRDKTVGERFVLTNRGPADKILNA